MHVPLSGRAQLSPGTDDKRGSDLGEDGPDFEGGQELDLLWPCIMC